MALPPWLDIRPDQFLRAMQAGTAAGHAAAQAAQQQWEEEQRLKLEEQRIEAQRKYNEAQLDSITQYRLGQLGLGKERLAHQDAVESERTRHGKAMEDIGMARLGQPTYRTAAGGLYKIPASGDVETLVAPPDRTGTKPRITIKDPVTGETITADPEDPALEEFRKKHAIQALPLTPKPGLFERLGNAFRGVSGGAMQNAMSQQRGFGGIPSTPTTALPSQPSEVIRTTKDGRKAVFDANSKKFLRYADSPDMGGNDTDELDNESDE